MRCNFIKRFLLVIVLINVFTITCLSQDCLNLYNLTLNDSILLKELNIEKLTDILGRPSAIKKNEQLSDILGPQVYYHDMGLTFWFLPKSKDPQQRIWSISVYLVKTWDKNFSKFFYPFSGKVVPSLNGNMKTNDIIPLFKNNKLIVELAEENKAKWDEALKNVNIKLDVGKEDIVRVLNNGSYVNIICEELTKFLERFTIIFEDYK